MSEIVVMPSNALAPADPMQALALAQSNALQFLSETKADKKEVAELRVANRQLKEQVAHQQAQIHQLHHNRDYYTVQALLSAVGEEASTTEKQAIGVELTRLSKELGIDKGTRPDDRFGSIGTYHPFVCKVYCERTSTPPPPAIKFSKDPR